MGENGRENESRGGGVCGVELTGDDDALARHMI